VRPGRAADHSPPSCAAVMEEQSYTSTHPLGHTGPITGTLYLYLLYTALTVISLRILCVILTKTSLLRMYSDITDVSCKHQKEHMNTPCEQSAHHQC